MFGIGLPEMLIIAAVALVFIGPDKLPGVLRSLGKGLVELKRATSDVRSTVQDEMHKIEEEINLKEVRESAEDLTKDITKDFDGVASKMDSLSIAKMSTGEQLESIAGVLDKTEKKGTESKEGKEESEQANSESSPEQNSEVTSTKPASGDVSAQEIPVSVVNDASQEQGKSSVSDKTGNA